jgi:hypothetical protein
MRFAGISWIIGGSVFTLDGVTTMIIVVVDG